MKYCCEKFQKMVETPETAFNRDTRFSLLSDGWWTDFSDGEYGDIHLYFCPFCGAKLTELTKSDAL